MDSKDQLLYNEETLKKVKDIGEQLKSPVVVPVQLMPEKMKSEIINEVKTRVLGTVSVDETPFNDLGVEIKEALDHVTDKIVKAVVESVVEPVREVTVKNITEAIVKEVSVKEIPQLQESIEVLAKAVIDNKPIVNVQKQEIVWPRRANEAIPVKLSDGKAFYTAMFTAVSNASVDTDPLVGYQPSDIDDTTTPKYYGFVKASGAWYIMRESAGSYRYCVGERTNSAGSIYPDAWTDRSNLSYSYFYEVF